MEQTQREWSSAAETAFIRFAEGRDVNNPRNAGDLTTFRYFCKDMMWRIDEIKYSEFLVDRIEDFRNTGMEKKRDVSFIQMRLDNVKAKDDKSDCSYDKVVRALVWLYDPNSPVNALYESKDNDKKVEMACRLAGITSSSTKFIPATVQYIKTLDNDLILSTAMCIRHILYSGAASSMLHAEDILFTLEAKVFAIAKATNDIDDANKALVFLEKSIKVKTNLEKAFDKMYGSLMDNPELRSKAEIKRRKNTTDRVKDFRDLVTVEEEVTLLQSKKSSGKDSWMDDDDDDLY